MDLVSAELISKSVVNSIFPTILRIFVLNVVNTNSINRIIVVLHTLPKEHGGFQTRSVEMPRMLQTPSMADKKRKYIQT